jgi:hypothetical protein
MVYNSANGKARISNIQASPNQSALRGCIMASKILLGLAFVCMATTLGCGGSGNNPSLNGRWVGFVFTNRAVPVEIRVSGSNFDGVKDGQPTQGTISTNTVNFPDGHYQYSLQNGRIEGIYISLGKQ